jgi:hypothetical protein
MKEAGPGTVTVQSSDEGVVADLDALMQTIPDPE